MAAVSTVEDSAATTGPNPRALRKQRRQDIGRAQILDEAEELFARQGYIGTSLEAIASASGFSVGGVYTFFGSKQDLYSAVMLRRGQVMQDRMQAWLSRDVSGLDKLLGMVSAVNQTLCEFPRYGRLVLQVLTDSFMSKGVGEPQFVAGVQRYARAIEQGQGEGNIRAGDPSRLAMLVAGLVCVQAQLDPVIAADADGIGRDDFLQIVRNALAP